MTWGNGEKTKSLCSSKFISVKATGLIGLPAEGIRHQLFDKYKKEAKRLESSRFATFELAITKPTDSKLDIQQ